MMHQHIWGGIYGGHGLNMNSEMPKTIIKGPL